MLNDDNSRVVLNEYHPMKMEVLSEHAGFACRRAVGEGYYDEKRDRTWISWNEKGMAIYIAYFDHEKGIWSKPEQVWDCGLYGRWDYHDYVTMIPDRNGEPFLIYHIHSQMSYIIRKNSEGRWERKVLSEDQNDYPAPDRWRDCIFYFYSRNEEISWPYRPLCFMKSMDDGETWKEPKVIVDSQKAEPEKFDEVYQSNVVFAPAGNGFPDRFLITFTMWGGERHAYRGKGAYCFAFYPEDERCYDLEGNCLGESVLYEDMVNICQADPGSISDSNKYFHVTYGPLVSVDEKNTPIVVYGHRDEKRTGLYMAVQKSGRWETKMISDQMWNIKDMERIGNGIELAVCCEGSIVIYRKEDGQDMFRIRSVTTIPHANGSNSVPWLNFITGGKNRPKLLLGLINRDDIEGYYSGKWPVVVLSQEE